MTLSAQRLEALLLHPQQPIRLSEDELPAVLDLLPECSDNMICKIFEGLHRESQFQVLNQMTMAMRHHFYEIYPELPLLALHFHQLSLADQEDLMRHLNTQRPPVYAALKRSSPLFRETAPASQERHSDEVFSSGLFSKLTTEVSSIEKALELAESLIETHKKNELLTIGKEVVDRFLTSYSYIGNKDVFQRYLYVVHFLDHLVVAQSGLDRYLPELTAQLIRVMAVMEESWILPVLTQLPLRFAEKVVQQLLHYERLADFEKRNMYCKLLNKVKSQARADNADYLRFLLSKG